MNEGSRRLLIAFHSKPSQLPDSLGLDVYPLPMSCDGKDFLNGTLCSMQNVLQDRGQKWFVLGSEEDERRFEALWKSMNTGGKKPKRLYF